MTDDEWIELFKANGHSPAMDRDDPENPVLDTMFLAEDIHNGPGCSLCYFSLCEHCDPTGKTMKPCDCIEGTLAAPAIEDKR